VQVPLYRTLARSDILAHFSGFVLLFAAGTMNMLNLPLLVVETLGGSVKQIGIAYSIAPAFEIPLMFYFGLLASRGHQARLIRAAAVIAVVYYTGLSLVQAPWHIYPLQVLSAALVSITSGVAISFFQDYLPDQPGTATNLFSSAGRLGSMVGYVAFGGLTTTFGHRGLFVVCTMLSAATAVIFFLRARIDRQRARAAGTALVPAA
jgi:MFS transporter, SET family, sugar efflux transporter